MSEPDPRTLKKGICGVVTRTEHFEFICIREPHTKVYRSKRNPGYKLSDNPSTEQHYMVNKWPYGRPMEVSDAH